MKNIATAVNSIRADLGVQPPDAMITWLNFLVYGEAGAGKTYLTGTCMDSEDTKPMLLLDLEGGTVTLRRRKDIDVVKVRTMQQVIDVHNKLFKAKDSPEGIPYKSVGIDSLSELQRLDLQTVMQAEYEIKPDTTDIDVASQRGWGKSRERLTRIIRSYRDLPVNLICTALLGSEYDEPNKVFNYFPALPGKLRGEVPGMFDVVGLLKTEVSGDEVVRALQVQKTKRVVAKDRTASLGSLVMNPTIPLMWELIHSDGA